MAIEFTISIPDDREDEVLEAFGAGYGPGGAPMTPAQLEQQFKDYLNNTVVAMHEGRELDRVRAERAIQVSTARVQAMNIRKVME